VAQDPDTVAEAAAIAREANTLLVEASESIARAYVDMSGLLPRVATRGKTMLARLYTEQERLRPILRRLRALGGTANGTGASA